MNNEQKFNIGDLVNVPKWFSKGSFGLGMVVAKEGSFYHHTMMMSVTIRFPDTPPILIWSDEGIWEQTKLVARAK
jgi:hypothetical protein